MGLPPAALDELRKLHRGEASLRRCACCGARHRSARARDDVELGEHAANWLRPRPVCDWCARRFQRGVKREEQRRPRPAA